MSTPPTPTSGFLRARSEEERDERRNHLMATARNLLDEGLPLAELSLNALARMAGMAKSNIYRYFESREAVLLALLVEDWTAWGQALKADWQEAPSTAEPVEQAAAHLARTLAQRRRLCLLTSVLPAVLEQNLSEHDALGFKLQAHTFLNELGGLLSARVPALSPTAAVQLLHDAVAALVGLYPMAYPAYAVERALRHPDLQGQRRDLERDLVRFVVALAKDLTAR